MNNLQLHIVNYLSHCEHQKRLDSKTLKAYRIDLGQFSKSTGITDPIDVSSNILEIYISTLHEKYKPKTVKRKIASLKAFFHYLEYREVVILNPFNKIQIKFREPTVLPKIIPLLTVESFYLQSTPVAGKPQLPISEKMPYGMQLSLNSSLQPACEFPNSAP